jgi:hypothetical protein
MNGFQLFRKLRDIDGKFAMTIYGVPVWRRGIRRGYINCAGRQ